LAKADIWQYYQGKYQSVLHKYTTVIIEAENNI